MVFVSASRIIVIFLVLVVILAGGAFWMKGAYFGGDEAPEEPLFQQEDARGDPLFGVYQGRTPCRDCAAIKIGLALYRDDETWAPTTYKLVRVYVGKSDERVVSEGVWKVAGDVEGYPDSVAYELDANAPGEFRSYWAINDELLLVLGKGGRPRVGDAGFGYLLNRTR